jgi:integrase
MWADGCRLNDADHLMRVCHRIVAKGLALLVGGALAFGASLLWSASNAAQPSSLQRLDDRGKTIRLSQPARRVVTLAKHKTLEQVGRRQVPLTPQGVRVLRVIWREGPLLPISSALLDALFRKLRDQVLLPDVHFHDSRGTALTHLARRVDVMTLARISGHKDLNLLLRVYYRETAAQISERLALPKR